MWEMYSQKTNKAEKATEDFRDAALSTSDAINKITRDKSLQRRKELENQIAVEEDALRRIRASVS